MQSFFLVAAQIYYSLVEAAKTLKPYTYSLTHSLNNKPSTFELSHSNKNGLQHSAFIISIENKLVPLNSVRAKRGKRKKSKQKHVTMNGKKQETFF